MTKRRSPLNIIVGRKGANTEVIIQQAIIDLLIEKDILSKEDIQTRIAELQQEQDRNDPYR